MPSHVCSCEVCRALSALFVNVRLEQLTNQLVAERYGTPAPRAGRPHRMAFDDQPPPKGEDDAE